MSARAGILIAAVLAAGLSLPARADPPPFAECEAAGDPVTAGQVACRRMPSAALGAETAFSYWVPPACAAPGSRCPVLYLLHGFGGDYRSMLGTAPAPSAWVRALTSAPPVDPHAVSDPWSYQDPAGWVPAPSIDVILVAPQSRTIAGGFGPEPGLDGFWADWNPRYAAGGDSPAYPTPAPRFETFVIAELIPFVEAHLPAGAGRSWRALAGTSLGGYGSYKIGLQHPDLFSSIGSVSGAHNFLFAPWLDPIDAPAPGVAPPVPLPVAHLPGVTPLIPLGLVPGQLKGFLAAFYALGDPVADNASYRGNMPRDLAMNARASSGGVPSIALRAFVNDAIPRRAEDFSNLPSYAVAQAFESIVLPMNLDMQIALATQGVPNQFEIHPGIHSGVYWNPFLREQLEAQYARVRHADGTGDPPPDPSAFDYRTVSRAFTIWGWDFQVARPSVEFLTLRAVSCDGLTLRGTGSVTVTVPLACGTGYGGSRTFTVDLGNAFPVDEQAGASALPAYGNVAHVDLTPL